MMLHTPCPMVGLTQKTRGGFASCIVFFQAQFKFRMSGPQATGKNKTKKHLSARFTQMMKTKQKEVWSY